MLQDNANPASSFSKDFNDAGVQEGSLSSPLVSPPSTTMTGALVPGI